MSGGQGLPVTIAGTATTTETAVAIVPSLKRGYPNSDGSLPTPKTLSTFLRGDIRIKNLDSTNNLVVRINNSPNRVTLEPNDILKLDRAIVFALSVQSSASTVAYDIIGDSSN